VFERRGLALTTVGGLGPSRELSSNGILGGLLQDIRFMLRHSKINPSSRVIALAAWVSSSDLGAALVEGRQAAVAIAVSA
jgi:hypothetical protein